MDKSIRMYLMAGVIVMVGMFGGVLAWAAISDLAGAVIAQAVVVVETNLKKVQHPTGGVVGELNIKDGARVKAGDILIRLDETITRANLQIVTRQIDELEVRRARLVAERDPAGGFRLPEKLTVRASADPEIARIVDAEKWLLESRRSGRDGQKSQLNERISQLKQEMAGLDAQLAARKEQTRLIASELVGVEELFKKNLVPFSRVTTLQREASRLLGEQGQLVSSAAQSRGKIIETELQILQLEQDLRTEVLRDGREVDGKMAELSERKVAAEDTLKRIDIKAPQDGIVHQLAVYTVGGVISAGEVLMYIVPQTDGLTIEAKIAPQDIDQVVVGQEATIRLSAFNQRTTPELIGRVRHVSAELTKEQQTGVTYFTAKVDISDEEMARLKGLKLLSGMPAEVHMKTIERSALSFILKPLTDQFARTMRER
jgi:HlyD family secretion protein